MKKRSLVVRVVALVLCAVMVIGVVTAAISVFAADMSVLSAPSPDTGSKNQVWVIAAAIVAVAVVAVCLLLPKFTKKK